MGSIIFWAHTQDVKLIITSSISEVLLTLDLKLIDSIKLIDGRTIFKKFAIPHNPDEYALYFFNNNENEKEYKHFAEIIKLQFPADYKIFIINKQGVLWKKQKLNIEEFELLDINGEIFIFFEPIFKNASLLKFKELIAHLRSPEGCPWDRKQTHKSLRTNLLEETYEVLETIDKGNLESLKEELGDLLLQIVLHAQIASENGDFNLFEVLHDIHKKITTRHPHVFDGNVINDSDDVLKNWEVIKQEERESNGVKKKFLSGIPKNIPALALAQKYQERAARVGFDWTEIKPVFDKVREELSELLIADSDRDSEMELGDLLFSVVNLARWYGYDAESLLRETSLRFKTRFEFIEEQASKIGKHLYDLSMEEMDELWEKAKSKEHNLK